MFKTNLKTILSALYENNNKTIQFKGSSGTIYSIDLEEHPSRYKSFGDFAADLPCKIEGNMAYLDQDYRSWFEFEFDIFVIVRNYRRKKDVLTMTDNFPVRDEYKDSPYNWLSHGSRNDDLFNHFNVLMLFYKEHFRLVYNSDKVMVLEYTLKPSDFNKHFIYNVAEKAYIFIDTKETLLKSIMRVNFDLSAGEINDLANKLEYNI